MEHIINALEHGHYYFEQSFGSNMSIVEWVLSQTPVVHGDAARAMFDALDVDEKNNPIIVASRISEVMSDEDILMLDIPEDSPWYPQQSMELSNLERKSMLFVRWYLRLTLSRPRQSRRRSRRA